MAALVGAGVGIALIPRIVQPLHRPGLVLGRTAGPAPTRNIFAAVRTGSEADPVLAAILAALRRSAARWSGHPGQVG
ncbi:LysR substrate-binding domain-containing protein [Streptacidiphilus sp. MAP12-16]|uniref:LysR substrate-binding domain-containing protein n=1 Tax=Streptacidiphilus sp. MAP12-16 TaxID=3156300 RepID=UPI003516104E